MAAAAVRGGSGTGWLSQNGAPRYWWREVARTSAGHLTSGAQLVDYREHMRKGIGKRKGTSSRGVACHGMQLTWLECQLVGDALASFGVEADEADHSQWTRYGGSAL